MISKITIASIIKKYYLGEIEQVKWEIKNKTLNIDFIAPSKIVIGNVSCNNFPIEDSSLAIYNTKKLSNLINITSGELLFEIEKQEQILIKLLISDANYNLTGEINDDNIKIRYNSDMFKLILYANKDAEEGKLQLSNEGLMKLNFKSGDIKSEYYMVPQEGGVY